MLFLLFGCAGDIYGLHGVWIETGVEHGGGEGHGRGREILYLLGAVVHFLCPLSKVRHVTIGATRMGGDEVWDELLVHVRLLVDAEEEVVELQEMLPRRLAHEFQHFG